jgi:hypothetical protein
VYIKKFLMEDLEIGGLGLAGAAGMLYQEFGVT